jgi:hypothetical protein
MEWIHLDIPAHWKPESISWELWNILREFLVQSHGIAIPTYLAECWKRKFGHLGAVLAVRYLYFGEVSLYVSRSC